MTAKEYLRQIEMLDVKIKQKQAQVEDLRDRAQSVGGQQTDSVRVQSSKQGDTIGRKVVRYAALEEEIEVYTRELLRLKNKIINQIQELQDVRYVELLFKRYVERKKLELIAVEMNYDYDYVRALHGYALIDFGTRFNLDEAEAENNDR